MPGHELFRETDYVDICLYINPFRLTFFQRRNVDKSLFDRNNDGKYIFFSIFEQSLTDWIDKNEREHKSQFNSCQINRT